MNAGLKIKICGVTRIEDAVLACELGATGIGLLFTGPRRVDLEKAREISRALPASAISIGVFTNEDQIEEIVDQAELGGVQFHGFDPSARLRERLSQLYLIRTFETGAALTSDEIGASPCEILLDVPRVPRGEERRPLAVEDVRRLALTRSFSIAGGLNPENVENYLRALRPSGIDLASGVESAPGIKCPTKLRALFAAIERSES